MEHLIRQPYGLPPSPQGEGCNVQRTLISLPLGLSEAQLEGWRAATDEVSRAEARGPLSTKIYVNFFIDLQKNIFRYRKRLIGGVQSTP